MLQVGTRDGLRDLAGRVELAGHRVKAVAADRQGRWAIVDDGQLHLGAGDGVWTVAARVDQEPTSIVGCPDGLLVGTAGAHLRLVTAGAVQALDSFERAPTRPAWHTPSGAPPEVRSMAVSSDGAVYVNVHVGGVIRSLDGGRSWADTIDLHADVHQVVVPRADRPGLVLAACADGLAQSRDSGATWALRDAGLRRTYCRAVALAGSTVLVSASEGPGGARAGVFRVGLEGKGRFERCRRGLPEGFEGNIDTGWLVADADVAAFASADGDVYVTTDEGASWEQAASGLPEPACLVLA